MGRIAHLVARELVHHRINAALSLLAVAAAVAICVALAILHDASVRETRRIQRDIGFNLRIIPRDTDLGAFYLTGVSNHTFDESAVAKLAANPTIAYNHIVGTLSKALDFPIDGGTARVIVIGIGEPQYPPGQRKPPMVKPMPTGSVQIGAEAARVLGAKSGGSIDLAGQSFSVARVSPESGTTDDIRIVLNLADAQRVLGEPGRINEIKAIDCLCLDATDNPQDIIRAEVERVIPDAKVVMLTSIADARAKQRRMIEGYVAIAAPLVLLVAGLWIAVLAMANVRERTAEIGLLRALGYGSFSVASVFLGRSIVIGVAGGLIGYAIGATLAVTTGPGIFRMTAKAIDAHPALLPIAVGAAAVGAAAACFIPAAIAVSREPSTTLRAD